MEKRGMSRVVKNVIIYLLIVIIGGVLFFMIKGMVEENKDSSGKYLIPTLEMVQVKKTSSTSVNVVVKENFRSNFYGVVFKAYDKNNRELGQYNLTLNQLRGRNLEVQFFLPNLSYVERLTIAPISKTIYGKQRVGWIEDEWIFSMDNDKIKMGECVAYSECEDNDKCTTNTCSEGFCVYPKITICKSNDGCCPAGCTVTKDNDCGSSA
jgi:hypothetical protein